jgi:hypothetical protein
MGVDTIVPGMDIEAFAKRHGVKFVRKDKSRLMRLLGWLFGLFGYDFMEKAWTTIGRTVYYPISLTPTPLPVHRKVPYRGALEHELHHVLQFKKLWHLYSLLYLLGVPFPFFLAWFRWKCEREPYLYQIKYYGLRIDRVVDRLWKVYGFCWPKRWMKRYFWRAINLPGGW